MTHLSVYKNYWEPFFKSKNSEFNGEQGKDPLFVLCEDQIEKSSLGITACLHSASLVMPNGSSEWIFLSGPHTHDIFLCWI